MQNRKRIASLSCPGWLPPMLQVYGRQWLRMQQADGPVLGTLGKVRTDGVDGAAHCGKPGQHWPEVYTGEGLEVHRVLTTADELVRLVVRAHYALPAPPVGPSAADKARALGLGEGGSAYWRALELTHAWLAGRLDPEG